MEFFYLSMAGQVRVVVYKHTAGAAYRHTAGGTEGNGAVQVFLDIKETVKHCRAFTGWHNKFLEMRFIAIFRVVSLHSECYLLGFFFCHNISFFRSP
jgi:hypothetical protein